MEYYTSRDLAYAGIIAALYAVLTVVLAPFSYGVYQIRVAEILTVLPFIYPPAIIGLFVGCLIANVFGGNGLQDIIFGSLFTLSAGYLTYLCTKIKSIKLGMVLAPVPPIIINAFGVAIYLAPITGMSYLFAVQMIGVGQFIACFILGLPFLVMLKSKKSVFFQTAVENER